MARNQNFMYHLSIRYIWKSFGRAIYLHIIIIRMMVLFFYRDHNLFFFLLSTPKLLHFSVIANFDDASCYSSFQAFCMCFGVLQNLVRRPQRVLLNSRKLWRRWRKVTHLPDHVNPRLPMCKSLDTTNSSELKVSRVLHTFYMAALWKLTPRIPRYLVLK